MDSAIKRAEKKLEYLSSDEEALALYRAREDSFHERANMIHSAKIEGKMEVAKNLLRINLAEDIISETTGLSLEQIRKIKSELH